MIPLNLKTVSGRCCPLALHQSSLEEIQIPVDTEARIRWNRPPIRDRACCSGDDGDPVPTPYFEVIE